MQGLTAQHLCYDAVPVPGGAVVLVHSAASGVGLDRTYPLNDAAQAHRDIESGKTVGKPLLLP